MPELFDVNFPLAYGGLLGEAGFRTINADFLVFEELGFTPSGEGEHVFLEIEKDGDNTAWIARQIAALAGVETRDIGYCGLKDRHGVTRQWFSVYLPKSVEPDWQTLQTDTLRVLNCTRHKQKLRRGQHLCNRFSIWLRGVTATPAELDKRLQLIAEHGVPNYFGPQRFGIDNGNLALAQRLLVDQIKIKNRPKRSMAISAARSYLFNSVLAERVRQNCWQLLLADETPIQVAGQPLPSGPLWGRGRPLVSGAALELETQVLADWQHWCEPLEFTGLNQDRRALVSRVQDLTWLWDGRDLRLDFALGVGCYATSVLAELLATKLPERQSAPD
ncbi:tRNA pseudouridine(13) synthase TruD [Gilvimarinus polysaccharolyticus]|uniref:tRNA pseudouridine(13) synthase TruD n=1 Tax=Gilvimarinus polysaccharolyticus TaxID=863921 RepID=UPI000673C1E0|nr:tRNA pseudouridine(13) synthase TruD [Gilvimarinus polysaccharolyticus]